MKNSTLAQATLLALTRQNLTNKAGPRSTYTVKATCIQRNIREGETVIVQKNDDGEINRLSDMLSFNNPFFVDSKNRLYDRVSSGNILRVRDGLSGEILDQGEHAYKFAVWPGVMGYCVTQASDNNNREVWRFVFSDGTKTKPIELPYTGTSTLVFGYRNGVLALTSGEEGSKPIWTYNKDGDFLYQLANVGIAQWPNRRWLIPVTATSVVACIGGTIGGIFQQAGVDYWAVDYPDHFDNFGHMYAVYHGTSSANGSQGTFLGMDQNYVYTYHHLHDPEDASQSINAWVVCRFAIDNYNGAETVATYTSSRAFSSVNNPEHLAVRYSSHAYVIDRATMGQAFSGELDLASDTTINMMENDGYIWDSPSGIYQKTSLGTVMWPSSIYPKTAPYGQCGYALYGVTVGSVGEAVILFS